MTRSDLIAALAARLEGDTLFNRIVPDAPAAIRLFMEVAHGNCCPGCGGFAWKPLRDWHLDCRRCGEVPMYRASPMARRKISALHVLAAIHAVWVDARTHSARGMGRERLLRPATAWKVLDESRGALPTFRETEGGIERQLLGKEAEDNRADVVVSVCGPYLTVLAPEDHGKVATTFRRGLPLWWGLLRAWLVTTFRGVSKGYLWKYLAEWVARQGRVRRDCRLHI